MKKFILMLVAAFIATASFAQTSTFSLDAGFGVEFEHYGKGGDQWTPQNLSGFFVEGIFEERFTQINGLSAGVRFNYFGLGDYAKVMDVKTTWKRGYIDVPVRYNLHLGGFFLNAGPAARFLVIMEHKQTNETTKESVKYNDLKNNKDELNIVHFCLGGGLGYEFKFGLRLFAEYNYDFTNLVKGVQIGGPEKTKSSVLNFGVGYRF